MPEYKYAKVKNKETKVCDVGIGTAARGLVKPQTEEGL